MKVGNNLKKLMGHSKKKSSTIISFPQLPHSTK